MYKFYNANVNNNFVNDCVIRSISVAEDKSWSETYDELSTIAKRNGILLDDVNFVEPLLDYRYERVETDRGETVEDFSERYPHGTYLITMKGHITVLKDGTIYDTFDCRDRILWDAWEVEKY